MPSEIQKRDVHDAELQQFLAGQSAYIFQQPAWSQVLQSLGFQVSYYCLVDGGRIVLAQPTARMRLVFFRLLYCGLPYGLAVGDLSRFGEFAALFPEVARRRRAFQEAHPGTKVISLGVGNTTEPLSPRIAEGLRLGAAKLGTREGYSGYGDEQGKLELRKAISIGWYDGLVRDDEVFVSDGAKCDLGRLAHLVARGRHAVPGHELLGERLARLELRGQACGPQQQPAAGGKQVGHAARQGQLRTDDREVGLLALGQREYGLWVAGVDRNHPR